MPSPSADLPDVPVGVPAGGTSPPAAHPTNPVNAAPSSEATVQWRSAVSQSFLAFTIANAERFTNEQGSRDAISGPFWNNYLCDIKNLHGWDDHDGFVTSYIAHPMEGAFAGFVFRQNDPQYRTVEFGSSQRYWQSAFRSLAFSTGYNAMWSLSPYGEAGLGNVDLHSSPGLVDPIGSEAMGFGWMVSEDAVDRYFIKKVEDRYENAWIRIFARSMLNPMRSYANLMRFHVPWDRDTRPGVLAYHPNGDFRIQDDIKGPKFNAKSWPSQPFELLVKPIAEHFTGRYGQTCMGGGGEASFRMSNTTAIVIELDGCTLMPFPQFSSGDVLNYTVGPRWFASKNRGWIPYAEVLVGGTKITHEHINAQAQSQLMQAAIAAHQPRPEPGEYTTTVNANGVTVLANAGLSYQTDSGVQFRVGNFGFQHSWTPPLESMEYNQDVRFSFGVAFRMGQWQR